MRIRLSRRTLFKHLGRGASFAALLSLLSLPLAFAASDFELTELGEELYLLNGAGGNVLVMHGDDGLVLVDNGNGSNTENMLRFLRRQFRNDDVRVAFNTHWHLGHTGGNEIVSAEGAEIIAHENTRLWMSTEIIQRWSGGSIYPSRSEAALPGKTFYYDQQSLLINAATVNYGHLPQGHTDGDIYVQFPAQNVIAAGGVVSGGGYPGLDYSTNGWIGGMIDSLRLLIELGDENTIYMPATGELRTRADLQAQLLMLEETVKGISASYYASQTFEEYLATDPMQAYNAEWGDPGLFLETAYEGAWWHINELRRYR